MNTFVDVSALIRPQRLGDTTFVLDVPEGVAQGRGAWGGVAAGAIASAAIQTAGDPTLEVRSMSAQLIAAVCPGRKQIVVEVLRRGSATLLVSVRLLGEGTGLEANGVVVLGTARSGVDMPDGPAWLSVAPPPQLADGPSAAPAVEAGPPLYPEFIGQVQMRPLTPAPFSGNGGAHTAGWFAPRGRIERLDAALLVALSDTWWVAVMPRLHGPRPVGTLTFTIELVGSAQWLTVGDDGLLEPLFHRATLIAAREGFTVETRELWTADGRLLTWNTQTVAVIK